MKFSAKIYHFYKNIITEILRVAIFFLLLALVILGVVINLYPNFFITLFCLFLIFEIYFSQKISKIMPKYQIGENSGDIFDSFSLEALGVYETHKDTGGFIRNIINLPQVDFIIAKLDARSKEIPIVELEREKIALDAFNIAKDLGGRYVTTMDLFVSYLMLSEPQTKFLFNKKIEEKDLNTVLLWAENIYIDEEEKKSGRLNFVGEGLAEDWVYGWTLETTKYMVDLSSEFLTNDKEPVGRQNEYKQLVEALQKGDSIILVGDTGSGRESAVRQLAMESYRGLLTGTLYHQKIFQLMVDAFLSGASTQGEIEARLNAILQELQHSGDVIVYIPEFQNLLGSQSFNLDISGAIIPYLKQKNIRIIAAITPGAYKKFVEPQASLLDVFNVIDFPPVTFVEVLEILLVKTLDIEKASDVSISYGAITAAIDFAIHYAKEKVMPGAAVDLLEDTANSVRLKGKTIVEKEDVLEQVKKKTHVDVGEPKAIEKTLLLNLEAEIHKKVISQNEAVSAISEAIRRLRSGITNAQKPISFLFLGPTGVGKTATAKTLADVYFGGKERFLRFDMSEFVGEDGIKKLLGSAQSNGLLTEAVFDNPYSLVLLDEFEKADQKILDLFLQVLDEGRLTDGKGKTVSFINTIIIATSNAASEFIRESVEKGAVVDKKFNQTLLEFLQNKAIFKPELLNRFDDIIVFKPLSKTEIEQIVKLMLIEFSKTLSQKNIQISFDQKVIEKITNEGYDKEFGARPLSRFIADNIEDLIARSLLKDEIKRGDSIVISLDLSGNIVFSK